MAEHKVVIPKNEALRLGKSKRNLHDFQSTEVCEIPISDESLITRSTFINERPSLKECCNSITVSPLFSECLNIPGTVTKEGVFSNRRSVTHPDKIFELSAQEGEWDTQEFVLDVKGVGIMQKYSEYVSDERLEKFIKKHKLKGKFQNKGNLPVFSFNQYLEFGTPEGSQDVELGDRSMEGFEYFTEQGFRLAIPLATIEYPEKIQGLAAEFKAENPVRVRMAQERRLLPSFVRGTYFEFNPDKQKLLNMISDDPEVLRDIPRKIRRDLMPYFEIIAETSMKDNEGFKWDYVGYVDKILNEPERLADKAYSWFLAKDWVIAGSGLYFVDLESTCIDEEADDNYEFEWQHEIYLTNLMKDSFRLLTHYNLALEKGASPERRKEIETRSRRGLVDRVNRSNLIKITENDDAYNVEVRYEKNIQTTDYAIPKSALPLVVTG